jgi:hypothetical protein
MEMLAVVAMSPNWKPKTTIDDPKVAGTFERPEEAITTTVTAGASNVNRAFPVPTMAPTVIGTFPTNGRLPPPEL